MRNELVEHINRVNKSTKKNLTYALDCSVRIREWRPLRSAPASSINTLGVEQHLLALLVKETFFIHAFDCKSNNCLDCFLIHEQYASTARRVLKVSGATITFLYFEGASRTQNARV